MNHNHKDQENSARPDGFTDRTGDLASKHAHEQGWRIIEAGKTTTAKAKNSLNGSKLFARAEPSVGDSAVEATAGAEAADAKPRVAEKVEKMTSPLVKRNSERPNVIWVRNKLEKDAA